MCLPKSLLLLLDGLATLVHLEVVGLLGGVILIRFVASTWWSSKVILLNVSRLQTEASALGSQLSLLVKLILPGAINIDFTHQGTKSLLRLCSANTTLQNTQLLRPLDLHLDTVRVRAHGTVEDGGRSRSWSLLDHGTRLLFGHL